MFTHTHVLYKNANAVVSVKSHISSNYICRPFDNKISRLPHYESYPGFVSGNTMIASSYREIKNRKKKEMANSLKFQCIQT